VEKAPTANSINIRQLYIHIYKGKKDETKTRTKTEIERCHEMDSAPRTFGMRERNPKLRRDTSILPRMTSLRM
jgi:hypothetical protein